MWSMWQSTLVCLNCNQKINQKVVCWKCRILTMSLPTHTPLHVPLNLRWLKCPLCPKFEPAMWKNFAGTCFSSKWVFINFKVHEDSLWQKAHGVAAIGCFHTSISQKLRRFGRSDQKVMIKRTQKSRALPLALSDARCAFRGISY